MPKSFSNLPPEVRHRIWGYCLPADKHEIYFYSRYDFPPGEQPLCRVVTPHPSILHVCREAASLGRSRMSFTSARHRDGGVVAVPCRPFRPALDAVYVAVEELEAITDALNASAAASAAHAAHAALFRDLTHLALESPCLYRDNWWTARRLLHCVSRLPALRTISMVFGRTWLRPRKPAGCPPPQQQRRRRRRCHPADPDPDPDPDPTAAAAAADCAELEARWDRWERTVAPPLRLEAWADGSALLVDGDAREPMDRRELLLDVEAVLSSHLAGASNDHADNHRRVQGAPSKAARLDREIGFRFSKMVTQTSATG